MRGTAGEMDHKLFSSLGSEPEQEMEGRLLLTRWQCSVPRDFL